MPEWTIAEKVMLFEGRNCNNELNNWLQSKIKEGVPV